jgi:hypothetical protein
MDVSFADISTRPPRGGLEVLRPNLTATPQVSLLSVCSSTV